MPAQSSSTSDSHACTSTAVSRGNLCSCGVERTGEWPPTVALESDCRSSKARGSSLSMIDPNYCDHRHPHSLTSCSVSPCLHATLLDGNSGPTSPCPSASSCSSPSGSSSSCSSSSCSSSSKEESSG